MHRAHEENGRLVMAADVTLYRDLDDVERDAGEALSRQAQPWMFDRLEWFRLAERHTLDGEVLVVKASNGRASCWIFLSQDGSSANAMSNWYCLRYGAVTYGPGGAEPPFAELVDGLRQAGVSHLFVDPIGENDALPSVLRRKGWLTRLEQTNVSWRIDTRGMSFEDYWSTRPSKLRNTAKRKTRKADLTIAIHQRFDATAWAELEEVFEASWKKPEGSPMRNRRTGRFCRNPAARPCLQGRQGCRRAALDRRK
jgi:hypothetical protein